jgi:hypothetical protein
MTFPLDVLAGGGDGGRMDKDPRKDLECHLDIDGDPDFQISPLLNALAARHYADGVCAVSARACPCKSDLLIELWVDDEKRCGETAAVKSFRLLEMLESFFKEFDGEEFCSRSGIAARLEELAKKIREGVSL